MSVIEELIRRDDAGTLSFGNYQLDAKTFLFVCLFVCFGFF